MMTDASRSHGPLTPDSDSVRREAESRGKAMDAGTLHPARAGEPRILAILAAILERLEKLERNMNPSGLS
jgi:hypothetical protein